MTWFQTLTGCMEASPQSVRESLKIDGPMLRSLCNNQSWAYGEFETPSLAELRRRAHSVSPVRRPISVCEVVDDVRQLHRDEQNAGALFQVASQFNLLEMTSPGVTPDEGVGIYEHDHTQGPACAIAAGAGTIYRNYFAPVNGQLGQSASRQIDCLSDIGSLLGNTNERLWRMVNGYALPTAESLKEMNQKLKSQTDQGLDQLRQSLRIGLQWRTQVTLDGASHLVSQAYCSAMPVAYTTHSPDLWRPIASLVLEAAYEATLCAALVNEQQNGRRQVFLTLLGGGAFGNNQSWILAALRRSLELHSESGLNVAIVSYGWSNPNLRQLAAEFSV